MCVCVCVCVCLSVRVCMLIHVCVLVFVWTSLEQIQEQLASDLRYKRAFMLQVRTQILNHNV